MKGFVADMANASVPAGSAHLSLECLAMPGSEEVFKTIIEIRHPNWGVSSKLLPLAKTGTI